MPGEGERERGREGPGHWGESFHDIDHIQFPAPHFIPVAAQTARVVVTLRQEKDKFSLCKVSCCHDPYCSLN